MFFLQFLFSSVHARYHFECGCEACENDWPKCSNLPSNLKGLAHSSYKDKSLINKLLPLLKAKDKKLKKKDVSSSEKVKICIECMKLCDSILKRPHALLCELENDLHQCLYAYYSESK